LRVVKLVEDGIKLTREISRGLQPVESGAEAFVSAFQELAAQTRERFGVECAFRSDQSLPGLEEVAATHLYRIAQESIVNAVRHGKPKRIDLGLHSAGGGLTLRIADDGIGLPVGAEGGGGLGLQIMRHRATMINATIDIQVSAGAGTIVTCTLGAPG
jgi:signal transduction histidine kinase